MSIGLLLMDEITFLVIRIFLNNEVHTGGHRRYLELLEESGTREHRVIALLKEDLSLGDRSF